MRPLAAVSNPIARWAFACPSLFWPFWSLPYWFPARGWGPGSGGKRVRVCGGAILNQILLSSSRNGDPARPDGWSPNGRRSSRACSDRTTTRVASENSQRNHADGASTAAALMIGPRSSRSWPCSRRESTSFRDAVQEIFITDYAVEAQNNFDPLPVSVEETGSYGAGRDRGVRVRAGEARILSENRTLTAVQPGSSKVFAELGIRLASDPDTLGPDGGFISHAFSNDHHLGQARRSRRTPKGADVTFTIKGIFAAAGGSPVRLADDREQDLRRPVRPASEHLHVRDHAGRRHGAEHGRTREDARSVPERESGGPRPVRRRPDQRPEHDPERPLRAARAVDHRQPLRHREHARAQRLRAHP